MKRAVENGIKRARRDVYCQSRNTNDSFKGRLNVETLILWFVGSISFVGKRRKSCWTLIPAVIDYPQFAFWLELVQFER